MAKKYLSGTMMCSLGKRGQVTACMYGTYKDFMLKTGLTRDYISETGNAKQIAAMDANPDGTLLWKNLDDFDGDYKVLGESHYSYKWKDAQPEAIERRKKADNERKERLGRMRRKREAEASKAKDDKIEKIASMLYGFESFNEPWEMVEGDTRDTFINRAIQLVDEI